MNNKQWTMNVYWTDALDTTVTLEETFYSVSEGNGTLEVCVIATGPNVSINISILPINNSAQGSFEWYLTAAKLCIVQIIEMVSYQELLKRQPIYFTQLISRCSCRLIACLYAHEFPLIELRYSQLAFHCKVNYCAFSSSNVAKFLTVSALPFSAAYFPLWYNFQAGEMMYPLGSYFAIEWHSPLHGWSLT